MEGIEDEDNGLHGLEIYVTRNSHLDFVEFRRVVRAAVCRVKIVLMPISLSEERTRKMK